MKVVHCVTVGPNRCGLYGTARDLLFAEHKQGIDAGFLDVTPVNTGVTINGVLENYKLDKDPLVPLKSYNWAKKADVYIRHSYIPVELQGLGKPLALALHGRPESSFRLETDQQQGIMSTIFKRAHDPRYKAFLCFWKEFMIPWQLVVPNEKLFYVPAPVDLDYYTPEGTVFDISAKAGEPNILIADIWREDIIPLNLLYAVTIFQQKYCKTAKLHILALGGKNLKCIIGTLAGMNKIGVLGGVAPLTRKINEFYRAMDMVITPHTIATRTVREPLACGIPIVAGAGNRYTPYTASHLDIDAFAKVINECWQDIKSGKDEMKAMARKTAEIAFNLENAGKVMKEVLEKIV
jgi:glycosyltransferase involved in cell wall biosynthesis